MKPTSIDIALLENALLAIEKVLAHADSKLQDGPHFGLAIDEPLRDSAAQSAANICLSAAAALVDVSKALMSAPSTGSRDDLAREWQALVTHTKIASRSAHRAALIMASQDDALSARGIGNATASPLSDAQSLSLAH